MPPGVVSNWLHDQAGPGTVLKVAPPADEFFLNEKEDNPMVLLSGGAGLTPMVPGLIGELRFTALLYKPLILSWLGLKTLDLRLRRFPSSMESDYWPILPRSICFRQGP